MEFLSSWHLWMIAAILLLILEIFSADFLFAAFAAACVAAGIGAAAGAELTVQLIILIAVSTLFLAVFRPLFKRFLYRKSDPRKSNAEAMLGRIATIVETTGSEEAPGRAKLGGEEWRSISECGTTLQPGESAEIVSVSGATLTLRKRV